VPTAVGLAWLANKKRKSASTRRGLVLVLALAALLFPMAARAGIIGVPLTDGTLILQVASKCGSAYDSNLGARER